jgi:hypothetical protein
MSVYILTCKGYIAAREASGRVSSGGLPYTGQTQSHCQKLKVLVPPPPLTQPRSGGKLIVEGPATQHLEAVAGREGRGGGG